MAPEQSDESGCGVVIVKHDALYEALGSVDFVTVIERAGKTVKFKPTGDIAGLVHVVGDDVNQEFDGRRPPKALSVVKVFNGLYRTIMKRGRKIRIAITAPSQKCGVAEAMAIGLALAVSTAGAPIRETVGRTIRELGIDSPNRATLEMIDGLFGLEGRLLAETDSIFDRSGKLVDFASWRASRKQVA